MRSRGRWGWVTAMGCWSSAANDTIVPVMDILAFLLGSALFVALVRWWRPEVSRRAAGSYAILAGLFFAIPLATPALQVPTDIAYIWIPWAEALPAKVEPANPV